MIDVAVVVVNYRTPAMTIACLESLEAEIDERARAVVVDNGSGDGSAEALERAIEARGWGGWAAVLRAPVNGGFAAGNNRGLLAIAAGAYLLLNSDALLRPGALRSLREAMALHPRAGVIGPRIVNACGGVDPSFFRAAAPVYELIRAAETGPVTRLLRRFDALLPPSDRPVEADWVSFACALVRAEVIRDVGLLDEGFFMYFEDVDFCRRAARAGWAVLHWPAAEVVHLAGGSSEVREGVDRRRRAPRYYDEARARYFAKFYGRGGLWLANCLWHAGRTVSFLRGLFGRPASLREREALDIWTNALHPLRPRTGATP